MLGNGQWLGLLVLGALVHRAASFAAFSSVLPLQSASGLSGSHRSGEPRSLANLGAILSSSCSSSSSYNNNRARGCAEANKLELIRTLRSRTAFTRVGMARMDACVQQLVASAPLGRPAASSLLDGAWHQQGPAATRATLVATVHGRGGGGSDGAAGGGEAGGGWWPTLATRRAFLGGLVTVDRRMDAAVAGADTLVAWEGRWPATVTLGRLLTFRLPRASRASSATRATADKGESGAGAVAEAGLEAAAMAADAGAADAAALAATATRIKILYLDSNLLITASGSAASRPGAAGNREGAGVGGGNAEDGSNAGDAEEEDDELVYGGRPPAVFIKPAEFREQVELGAPAPVWGRAGDGDGDGDRRSCGGGGGGRSGIVSVFLQAVRGALRGDLAAESASRSFYGGGRREGGGGGGGTGSLIGDADWRRGFGAAATAVEAVAAAATVSCHPGRRRRTCWRSCKVWRCEPRSRLRLSPKPG